MRKYSLFGIAYTATNYDEATRAIIDNAVQNNSYGVLALAVHGLIEAYRNLDLRDKVNLIDLIVPDGQPIRWALNSFYNTRLKDRVYGPALTLKVLEKANVLELKVYLYGSTQITCDNFVKFIETNYNQIKIVGVHVDRFREANTDEDIEDIIKINVSGANIVLVGRGCPRQEIWVSNHLGKVNASMLAVGAAFDFCAGTVKQSPKWMQDWGLEWLFSVNSRAPQALEKIFSDKHHIYIFVF